MGSYGGLKGSEQGDVMSSLLQNSDPRVQDRLEMMDWPRGTVAWLREGRKEVDDVRVERPGPGDQVGVRRKGKDCGGEGSRSDSRWGA